jgi:general secretion pathway protein M
MNTAPTTRLASIGRMLAALGYVAAVALLLALTWSSVAEVLERRQSVAAASDLLAQLEGRRPGSRASQSGAPDGTVPTGSPFLEGQTLTVAGAALLQRVADAVTKVGGSVLSSQVDVQGVQAKDGYVSVLASCEVEQASMQRLLYDLEAGMPFLFIEQFVAQAPQTGQTPASGRMRLLLAVSGRWQGTP